MICLCGTGYACSCWLHAHEKNKLGESKVQNNMNNNDKNISSGICHEMESLENASSCQFLKIC